MSQQSSPVKDTIRPWLGVFFVVVATIVFAFQDAITKALVSHYPAGFILAMRYWLFFVVGLLMLRQTPGGVVENAKTKHPFLQMARGVFLVSSQFVMALAFFHMGLAEATALFQSYPLYGTVLAAFLLGEMVGIRRTIAVLVGFCGVLIILRPGSGILGEGTVYAVLSAILYAFYIVLTRLVAPEDRPITSFFYVGLVGAIIMTAGLPFYWVSSMPMQDILLLALLCIMSITGHFFIIKALSLAPVMLVQPFNYLQLVWSVFVGFFIFRDVPDRWTVIGAIIVVGSGLSILLIEARRKKETAFKKEAVSEE